MLRYCLLAALVVVIPAADAGILMAPTPTVSGFSETTYFTNSVLSDATGMAWAPDSTSRLFVILKGGTVRVIQGGAMTTWYNFAGTGGPGVTTTSECGLIGMCFDPSFTTNGYVYFFVTVTSSEQRIYRLTDSGGAGTALTLIKGGLPTIGANHDGGAIAIGPDGYLYWAVGDNGSFTSTDDSLDSLQSKVGRCTLTGAAVSTNFWYNASDGITDRDYIFARGFRNPFTMTFHPTTGELWVNVVGSGYEQVFRVANGNHAGWNTYEGGSQPAGTTATGGGIYIDPVISYVTNGSGSLGGCICGGTFYTGSMYPSTYVNNYFWGDYNSGTIYRSVLNAAGTSVTSTTSFVTGVSSFVDIVVGPDGALYYKGRANGSIYRLAYTTTAPPNIVTSTGSMTIAEGTSGTFTVNLSSAPSATTTVNVARTSGDTSINPSPSSLSFTTSNWATPQTVTVTASEDADFTTDSATITCSATGLTSQNVAVTATDNDTAPSAPSALITNPLNGQVVGGQFAEFYGNGTDDIGTVSAEFYVDGSLQSTDTNSSGHYHFGGSHNQFNTTGLSNGSHTLEMRVYDAGGLSGSHIITVTIDNSNIIAFGQDGTGMVSMEAENHDDEVAQGGHQWDHLVLAGSSGGEVMEAMPNTGATVNTGYTSGSPRMDYNVNFTQTGTHYVWIRGTGPSGADDTVHVGLDGVETTTSTSDRIGSFGTSLVWLNSTLDGVGATIDVPSTGLHTLNVWMREDGFRIDKIVLATSGTYTPSGAGPAESARVAVGSAPPPGGGGGGGGGHGGCGMTGWEAVALLALLALRRSVQ
jgi:glucose/arabinose dehydrogenase